MCRTGHFRKQLLLFLTSDLDVKYVSYCVNLDNIDRSNAQDCKTVKFSKKNWIFADLSQFYSTRQNFRKQFVPSDTKVKRSKSWV